MATSIVSQWEKDKSEKKETDSQQLKAICKKLSKYGIKTIEVRFCGSGDSGEVEEVKFISATKEYDSQDLPELQKAVLSAGLGDDIEKLSNEIGDIAVEFIEGDWYNNDGGQGTIYIDTKRAHLRIEVGYNEMTTNECTEEVNL